MSNLCCKSLVYVTVCASVRARACVLNGLAGLLVIMSYSMVSICRGPLHELAMRKAVLTHEGALHLDFFCVNFGRNCSFQSCAATPRPGERRNGSRLTDESFRWLQFLFEYCDLGLIELCCVGLI